MLLNIPPIDYPQAQSNHQEMKTLLHYSYPLTQLPKPYNYIPIKVERSPSGGLFVLIETGLWTPGLM